MEAIEVMINKAWTDDSVTGKEIQAAQAELSRYKQVEILANGLVIELEEVGGWVLYNDVFMALKKVLDKSA